MAAPTAAGVTAGGTRAGSGTTGAGAIVGAQIPAGDGHDEGGAGRSWGCIAAGFATALAALLLFIAVPTVLITQHSGCVTGSVANGVADSIDLDALTIATRIYDVSRDMRMAEGQLLSAYITVLVESGGGVTMRNPPDGDRSSVGAFQQQDLPEWTHDGRNRLNVSDAARSYFEAARKHDSPGISPGELATRVQRMDVRYAGRYLTAEVLARAKQFLAQVKGGRGAAARLPRRRSPRSPCGPWRSPRRARGRERQAPPASNRSRSRGPPRSRRSPARSGLVRRRALAARRFTRASTSVRPRAHRSTPRAPA